MQVTDVWVNKHNSGKLRGFADVEIDGVMRLKGFRIFENTEGLHVGLPSRPDKEGNYRDTVIVDRESDIGQELLATLKTEILGKYHRINGDSQDDIPI
jgi:DNA-binding cell septation regulator SpoVG